MTKITISLKSNKITCRQFVDLTDRKDSEKATNAVQTSMMIARKMFVTSRGGEYFVHAVTSINN